MKRSLFFILIAISLLPASAQSGGTITVRTEAAMRVVSGGGFVALSEEKFFEYNRKYLAENPRFVGIKQKPARLTAAALFGFNLVIEQKNLSWVLDHDAKNDYVLYADLNADADLSNDKPIVFKKIGGKDAAEFHKTLTEMVNNQRRKYAYDLWLEIEERVSPDKTEKQIVLKIYDDTARRGSLTVNNQKVGFVLNGASGIYDYDFSRLYFDLNGDGKFDSEDPFSAESFRVDEKYINIGENSYEFTVDRYGNRLTLKPLGRKLPARADLRVGNTAPDFSFKDFEGNQRRLSEFRGKIVLIDVWALWCAPCVREAPKLSAVYQKLKEKNFEIISLNKNDPPENVRKFIAEHRMNWTHTMTDDAFLKLYRVDQFPTYFLIDKDGKIVSNTLRAGEEMYKKVEELTAF